MAQASLQRVSERQLADFAELATARATWARGDLDLALSQFEAAVRKRPGNVKGLLEAARAFGGRHEIAHAERYLDKARSLAGTDPRVAPLIAQTYARCFRPQRALEELERLGTLPPSVQGEVAVLYEQVGKLEQALDAIDACIRLAPVAAEPRLVRGRILRRMGRLDEATVTLEPLAVDPAPPLVQAEAATELCYVHDARREFDRAVDAIEHAHGVIGRLRSTQPMLQRARANNAALADLASAFAEAGPPTWLDAKPELDARVAGIAHLIGFPRSGTTLLEQCLDAHPSIVASPERVIFSRDIFPRMCKQGGGALTLETLDAIPDDVIGSERRRYLDFMEAALGEPLDQRLHIDKNPNHTTLLPGLLRLFPESKFIVAVRDPRDVIASCVLRSFRLTEFSSMLLSWDTACELYAVEMGAWLRYREALDAERWIEVRYEDAVTDLAVEARHAIQMLGVAWDNQVLAYRERTRHKLVNSPTQTEVREPIYTSAIGRWKNYRKHLEPHVHVLQPFIDAFGYE